MKRNRKIPVQQLADRVQTGLDIKHFLKGEPTDEVDALGAHRDDHYMFFLLKKGSVSLMIDFNEVQFEQKPCLYYVLPGQVHYRIRNRAAEGWYMAVDTALIRPDFRAIFESKFLLQQPRALSGTQSAACEALLNLLYEKYLENPDDGFNKTIIRSLLDAYIGIFAGYYQAPDSPTHIQSRPFQLSHQFRKLLMANFHTVKSPHDYAEKLHVSTSYLNEVVCKVTGFSVSHWIIQEIMMEAKRLLYYSELNVKEIAFDLGYEDYAYFSRLFKKESGMTALEFRNRYRE